MQNTKTFRSLGNLTTPSAPGGVFCCRTHTYVGVKDGVEKRKIEGESETARWLIKLGEKRQKTSSVICDAWHFSQFMCLYLIRQRGRGRGEEWLPKGVAVWQQERKTERVRERRRSAASMRPKTEAEAEAENFSVAPKLSLNTNVTPNASFCHAPTPPHTHSSPCPAPCGHTS